MNKCELEVFVENGFSIRKISEITGMSATNVSYWLKKFGLVSKGKNGRPQVREKSKQKECTNCKNQFTKKNQMKFCSPKCQAEYQHNKYIDDWLNNKVSGGSGEGAVSSFVRKWLFQRANGKCEGKLDDGSRCGWSRVHSVTKRIPLTVNHKDGNSENHRPENLELFCPSCHALTPNFGSLNTGNGRKRRLEKIRNRKLGS